MNWNVVRRSVRVQVPDGGTAADGAQTGRHGTAHNGHHRRSIPRRIRRGLLHGAHIQLVAQSQVHGR